MKQYDIVAEKPQSTVAIVVEYSEEYCRTTYLSEADFKRLFIVQKNSFIYS
jgi:hypothetical protein